jgi:hypothetical protein
VPGPPGDDAARPAGALVLGDAQADIITEIALQALQERENAPVAHS